MLHSDLETAMFVEDLSPRVKKLLHQFSVMLSGGFLGSAIQATTLLLMARWSSPSDFGIAISLIGVFTVAQAVGDAGTTVYCIREAAKDGVNGNIKAAEKISFLCTLFVVAVLFLILFLLGTFVAPFYYNYLILCPWLVFERALNLKGSVALGLGQAGKGVRNLILRRSLHLILFFAFVGVGFGGVVSYIVSATLSVALIYLITIKGFYKESAAPAAVLPEVFRVCRSYWLHSLTIQVRNLDALIVTSISGPLQGAYYGLASRLTKPLQMVAGTAGSALLPFLAQGTTDRTEAKFIILFSIAMALPFLVLAYLSPWLTVFLFGIEYIDAVLPVKITVVALGITSGSHVLTAALQAKGYAQELGRAGLISTISIMSLLAMGASIWGALGAAVGLSLGLILNALLLSAIYVKVKVV